MKLPDWSVILLVLHRRPGKKRHPRALVHRGVRISKNCDDNGFPYGSTNFYSREL